MTFDVDPGSEAVDVDDAVVVAANPSEK